MCSGVGGVCVVLDPHPGDVNLTDHVLSRLNVFAWFGDEDAFALATCIWLTDVRFAFFGPGVSLEVTVTAKHRCNKLDTLKKDKLKEQSYGEKCKLTLREGTTFWGRCCSLWGKAWACGSCFLPVNLCGRSHSFLGNGLFSAKTNEALTIVYMGSTLWFMWGLLPLIPDCIFLL